MFKGTGATNVRRESQVLQSIVTSTNEGDWWELCEYWLVGKIRLGT